MYLLNCKNSILYNEYKTILMLVNYSLVHILSSFVLIPWIITYQFIDVIPNPTDAFLFYNLNFIFFVFPLSSLGTWYILLFQIISTNYMYKRCGYTALVVSYLIYMTDNEMYEWQVVWDWENINVMSCPRSEIWEYKWQSLSREWWLNLTICYQNDRFIVDCQLASTISINFITCSALCNVHETEQIAKFKTDCLW